MIDDQALRAELISTLGEAAKTLHQAFVAAGGPVPGVDSANLMILMKLGDQQLRVSQLAEMVHSTVSTVSRQLTNLEGMGLVSKTRDTADGRAQVVQLTDQGRQARSQVLDRRATLIGSCLREMSSQEVEEFLRLLRLFTQGIHAHLQHA